MTVDSHAMNMHTDALITPATHPRLTALPAFSDNYIWALESLDKQQCLIVDPGDPIVVGQWLAQRQLQLTAILITHHHADHVGGIAALRGPGVTVYGPRQEKIAGLDVLLGESDSVDLEGFGIRFAVLDVPGHTLGHIAYIGHSEHDPMHEPPLLFCGDTLFSAGCGRLFEGTAAQMHASLSRLASLPDATLVCCAHEYTLGNLRFATAVEAENPDIATVTAWATARRSDGNFTVPSTIHREKCINPFLRGAHPDVVRTALARDSAAHSPADVFAALRRWKDEF